MKIKKILSNVLCLGTLLSMNACVGGLFDADFGAYSIAGVEEIQPGKVLFKDHDPWSSEYQLKIIDASRRQTTVVANYVRFSDHEILHSDAAIIALDHPTKNWRYLDPFADLDQELNFHFLGAAVGEENHSIEKIEGSEYFLLHRRNDDVSNSYLISEDDIDLNGLITVSAIERERELDSDIPKVTFAKGYVVLQDAYDISVLNPETGDVTHLKDLRINLADIEDYQFIEFIKGVDDILYVEARLRDQESYKIFKVDLETQKLNLYKNLGALKIHDMISVASDELILLHCSEAGPNEPVSLSFNKLNRPNSELELMGTHELASATRCASDLYLQYYPETEYFIFRNLATEWDDYPSEFWLSSIEELDLFKLGANRVTAYTYSEDQATLYYASDASSHKQVHSFNLIDAQQERVLSNDTLNYDAIKELQLSINQDQLYVVYYDGGLFSSDALLYQFDLESNLHVLISDLTE